jgi:hypothetical protein
MSFQYRSRNWHIAPIYWTHDSISVKFALINDEIEVVYTSILTNIMITVKGNHIIHRKLVLADFTIVFRPSSSETL